MVILCKSIFFRLQRYRPAFPSSILFNDDFQDVKIPINGEVAFFAIDVNLCPEKRKKV